MKNSKKSIYRRVFKLLDTNYVFVGKLEASSYHHISTGTVVSLGTFMFFTFLAVFIRKFDKKSQSVTTDLGDVRFTFGTGP